MNSTLNKLVSILLVGAIAATSTPRTYAEGQPCGNQSPGGDSTPPEECEPCEEGEDTEASCPVPEDGTNAFSAYTGNAHRKVVDLAIFGSVGRLPLRFVRYSNTRGTPQGGATGRFGRDTVWTHNYQWFLRDAGTYQDMGLPALRLGSPEGGDTVYVQQAAGSIHWLPPANSRSRIEQNGTIFTLRLHTGELYHFHKLANAAGTGSFYRLGTCEDSIGNIYTFTYNSATDILLRRVQDPSGRWLRFIYQNLGSFDQQNVTLGSFPYGTATTGTATGQWVHVDVTNTTACRFLTLHLSNSFRNDPPLPVGEVEFYSTWDAANPANNVKITGTPFGSDPYFNDDPALGPTKAFDGDPATYYRYKYLRNGYVGLDAGTPVVVEHIRFWIPAVAATPGIDGSAVPPVTAGQFVGLNENPNANQAIVRVEGGMGNNNTPVYGSVTYEYEQQPDPSGWFRWYKLIRVLYPNDSVAPQAFYGYTQVHDFTPPILSSASDPRIDGVGTRIEYQFDPDTALGFLRKEKSLVTGATIAETASDGAHKPKVIYPGGPGGQRVVKYEHYLTNGNLKAKTDGAGRVLTMTYADGNAGHLNSVKVGAAGPTIVFQPSVLGNRQQITRPDGSTDIWERDIRERPTVMRRQNPTTPAIPAQVTTYQRDALGRVERIDHPDGSYETFTFDPYGQVIEHRLRNGATETNSYEPGGRRLTHTDAVGVVRQFSYDSRDLVSAVTVIVPGGVDRQTEYQYNDRGQVKRHTFPDLTFVDYEYDTYGNQTARVDELGHRWTASYDEFKRRVTSSEPPRAAGQPVLTTTYGYEEPGAGVGGGCCGGGGGSGGGSRPTSITLPSGKQTLITYDGAWRKLTETVGAGTPEAATTHYEYDPRGDLTRIVDPRGKAWEFNYDVRHRRTAARSPIDIALNTPGTQWSYDFAGNKKVEIRPDGTTTLFTYDVMNRLVSTLNANGEATTFAYGGTHWVDPASGAPLSYGNNLVRLTDARGKHYHFAYDLADRKTSMIYPGGSHEDWTYDVPGNVATYRTRAGQVKTCAYDLRDRDLTCDWSDTTKDVKKTYDNAGRVLTMANGTLSGTGATATLSGIVSALTYTYDDANNLLSETQDLENPVNLPPKTVAYTYDADGNRASLTYPGGTVVEYTYTARNQLKDVIADGPPPLAAYTYDLAGNRIGKALENGTHTAYEYDDANRLLSIDHRKAGVTLQRFDYTLDILGNRTTRAEANAGQPTRTDAYGYDFTDQLTQVKYDQSASGTNYTRKVDYDYDAAGNREAVMDDTDGTGPTAPLTTPYTANDLNQYTSIDSLALPTYDNNGNLTTMQAKLGDPVWTYQFDAQNRLIEGNINNVPQFTFTYDARNRCVARTFGGTATTYVFSEWNLLEDRSSSDALLARYIHGASIDEILTINTDGGALFHHRDGVDCVTSLTDVAGDSVEHYKYDVFGMPAISDGAGNILATSSYGNRFLFMGREWLQGLNLYDIRNRYYSVSSGVFLQVDPIRFDSEDANLYRYVGNNPVFWTDPFGESKGGKKNISCEGFDKNSDPKEVEAAMKAAKEAGKEKSYRALRGLLKVIRRGGFLLEFWLQLLEEACKPECEDLTGYGYPLIS
jgi:RHS repeat-associated protein